MIDIKIFVAILECFSDVMIYHCHLLVAFYDIHKKSVSDNSFIKYHHTHDVDVIGLSISDRLSQISTIILTIIKNEIFQRNQSTIGDSNHTKLVYYWVIN
jgi:hypothetical protein